MVKFKKVNSKGMRNKVMEHLKECMGEENIRACIEEYKFNDIIARKKLRFPNRKNLCFRTAGRLVHNLKILKLNQKFVKNEYIVFDKN